MYMNMRCRALNCDCYVYMKYEYAMQGTEPWPGAKVEELEDVAMTLCEGFKAYGGCMLGECGAGGVAAMFSEPTCIHDIFGAAVVNSCVVFDVRVYESRYHSSRASSLPYTSPSAAPDTKALIREAVDSLLSTDLLDLSYAGTMKGFFAAVFPLETVVAMMNADQGQQLQHAEYGEYSR